MRRDFSDRYKHLVKTSPAVLREIYQELTGDSSAAPTAISKEMQARLRVALETDDPEIVYDLRHLNEGRRCEFDSFWDATKAYIKSLLYKRRIPSATGKCATWPWRCRHETSWSR